MYFFLAFFRSFAIAPLWKSSFGIPVLKMESTGAALSSTGCTPKFQGLLIKGKARNSLFGSRTLNFDVIALRIDFSRPRPPVVDEYPICPLSGYATIKYAPQIGLVFILSVM